MAITLGNYGSTGNNGEIGNNPSKSHYIMAVIWFHDIIYIIMWLNITSI